MALKVSRAPFAVARYQDTSDKRKTVSIPLENRSKAPTKVYLKRSIICNKTQDENLLVISMDFYKIIVDRILYVGVF